MKLYRVHTDDRPEEWWEDDEQDGLWESDRSLVEDEFAVHSAIGSTNPRIEERDVCDHCSGAGLVTATISPVGIVRCQACDGSGEFPGSHPTPEEG